MIVFFGDSLTAGYGLDDPSTEGFPLAFSQRSKRQACHIAWSAPDSVAKPPPAVFAGSIGFCASPSMFFLALGANDGLRGIEPSVSKANLQAIIDRVSTKNPAVKIVLAGMMMPPSMGESYVRDFAAIYPALAKKNQIPFVPFLLAGVGGDPLLNQRDRIHPTAAGQAVIAETVWNVLRPLL